MVEAQAIVAAALGRPRGGRAAAAGLVAAGRLAAIRGGRSSGVPEGRLLARDRSRLRLQRRKRPPQGSGTSTARCNAGSWDCGTLVFFTHEP
jgi:hypothetical protein